MKCATRVIAFLITIGLCLHGQVDLAAAESHTFSGANVGKTPDNNPGRLILDSWAYPGCDPNGMDYDASTGLLWIVDQGSDECLPRGEIRTFDPMTGLYNLEFVVSEVLGLPDVSGNGIEVVGEFVYVSDFNGDATTIDDSIYKFTKAGDLVWVYDVSQMLDRVLGLGYLDDAFYAVSVGDLSVHVLAEDAEAGLMTQTGVLPLPPGTGGGWLDYEPDCDVFLRTSTAASATIWALDPEDFSVLGTFPSEVGLSRGVSYGPRSGSAATVYVVDTLNPADIQLIYKSNEFCVSASVAENSPPRPMRMRIYPNPVRSHSILEWEQGPLLLKLYDPLGRLIVQGDFASGQVRWGDLVGDRSLPPGVYFLESGQQTARVVVTR